MASSNHTTQFGRFTADPVLMTTANNKTVVNFTIAVENPFVKDEGGNATADFFDCSAWGKTAEVIAKNFKKGYRISLDGRLCSRMVDYKPKNGNGISFPIRKVDILVETFTFIETEASIAAMGNRASQQNYQNNQPAPQTAQPTQATQSPQNAQQSYQNNQPTQATQQTAQPTQAQQAWAKFTNSQAQNTQPPQNNQATQPPQNAQQSYQNNQPAPQTAQPQNWQNNAQNGQNSDNGYNSFFDVSSFADMDFSNSSGDDFPF